MLVGACPLWHWRIRDAISVIEQIKKQSEGRIVDSSGHKFIFPAAACRIISASRDVICSSPVTSMSGSYSRLPTAISRATAASAALQLLRTRRSTGIVMLPSSGSLLLIRISALYDPTSRPTVSMPIVISISPSAGIVPFAVPTDSHSSGLKRSEVVLCGSSSQLMPCSPSPRFSPTAKVSGFSIFL